MLQYNASGPMDISLNYLKEIRNTQCPTHLLNGGTALTAEVSHFIFTNHLPAHLLKRQTFQSFPGISALSREKFPRIPERSRESARSTFTLLHFHDKEAVGESRISGL